MPEPTLLAALDEGVLTLTLNRPAKLNAIDHTLAAALLDALQAAADDPQVRVMLAAVHGWTVGAGFEWAMDADVVVAADDARFKLPEASLGVFVTGGLVATLPAAAGLPRLRQRLEDGGYPAVMRPLKQAGALRPAGPPRPGAMNARPAPCGSDQCAASCARTGSRRRQD